MLKLIIDTREQTPYAFTGYDAEIERGALDAGDYSLEGFEDKIAVERKSLDDFITCLSHGRERFERELRRARGLDYFAVIIEAPFSDIMAGRYRSRMTVNAVVETIAAFSTRYRTPIFFCGTRAGGERMTYSLLAKYAHNLLRGVKALQKAHKERKIHENLSLAE